MPVKGLYSTWYLMFLGSGMAIPEGLGVGLIGSWLGQMGGGVVVSAIAAVIELRLT